MALIKCPECGKEVSDHADKCINCGYPLHEPKTITMDTVKERAGEAVKAGKTINDKVLAVNNLDKIMLWSAVGLLLIIMFVVAVNFRGKPIIGDAEIGMAKYNGPIISDHSSKNYREHGKIQQESEKETTP